MNKIKTIALTGILATGSLALGSKKINDHMSLLNPNMSFFPRMRFNLRKKNNLKKLMTMKNELNAFYAKATGLACLNKAAGLTALQNNKLQEDYRKAFEATEQTFSWIRPLARNYWYRVPFLEKKKDQALAKAKKVIVACIAAHEPVENSFRKTLKTINKNGWMLNPEITGDVFSSLDKNSRPCLSNRTFNNWLGYMVEYYYNRYPGFNNARNNLYKPIINYVNPNLKNQIVKPTLRERFTNRFSKEKDCDI